MDQQNEIYESLFIFHKCITLINRLWSVVEENQSKIDEVERFAVLNVNYLKLESVSFLEEFSDHFKKITNPKYISRIKDVVIITQPIVTQIFKWKHLKQYRNQVIAHGWRDKNGKFIIPHDYDVPETWFEAGLLVDYMNYIFQIIHYEFTEEIYQSFKWIDSIAETKPKYKDYKQVNNETLDLAKQVYSLCVQRNKPYFLKVKQYLF